MTETNQTRTLTLKRLAAILAVLFVLASGLCGVAANSGRIQATTADRLVYASVVVGAISLFGLLVTAIVAIIQAILRRNTN